MKTKIIIALSIAALVVSCDKKTSSAQQRADMQVAEAAEDAAGETTALREPKAEFTDAARQKQYEKLFGEYLEKFAPPDSGAAISIARTDGSVVAGTVDEIVDTRKVNTIIIKTALHRSRIAADQMSDESRGHVFLADFARQHAMACVNGKPLDAGTAVARPFVRHPLHDGLTPRTGPGLQYSLVEDVSFAHDASLTVCAESGGWIEILGEGKEAHLWIPRFESFAADEFSEDALQQDINIILATHSVERIAPEKGDLFVDAEVWMALTPAAREGVARTVAAYCAVSQKRVSVSSVVIDAGSAAELGKYNSDRGWFETLPSAPVLVAGNGSSGAPR